MSVPWRDRQNEDPLTHALVWANATDSQAADAFAEQCAWLRAALKRALETAPPPVFILRPDEVAEVKEAIERAKEKA